MNGLLLLPAQDQCPTSKNLSDALTQKSGLSGELLAAELKKRGVPPNYDIVPGCDLRSDEKRSGKWFADYTKMPGIRPNDLPQYPNKWKVFER